MKEKIKKFMNKDMKRSFKLQKSNKNQIKCPNCGYEGIVKKYIKGSVGIEIVLWLFALLPGFIYSIWRLNSRHEGCPRCGYEYVVKK